MNDEPTDLPAQGRLEELYVRYAPGGFRLAYLLTGDRQAAEDCVQEAFVRIIGRLAHIRTAADFDGYLRKTIVNLTKNAWRHGAVERRHTVMATPPPRPIPAGDIEVIERLDTWRTILSMPLRQRTAIVLRFYEDLSERDIAFVMNCRPGTVRSLVSRGMATIRNQLERSTDA